MAEDWCDVMALIVAIIALVPAIRACILSKEANKHADEANILSQKALKESEKDFFPLVQFVGDIRVEKKKYITLCNEVSFDFIEDLFNYDEHDNNDDDDKITCICFKLKNISSGVLTGITLKGICIQEGNPLTFDQRFQGNSDVLFFKDPCDMVQEVIVCPGDEIEINLLIDDLWEDVTKNEQEYYEERIRNFFDIHNNVTVGINLQLSSINKSSYEQNWLFGTFLNKRICLNSIGSAEKIETINELKNR